MKPFHFSPASQFSLLSNLDAAAVEYDRDIDHFFADLNQDFESEPVNGSCSHPTSDLSSSSVLQHDTYKNQGQDQDQDQDEDQSFLSPDLNSTPSSYSETSITERKKTKGGKLSNTVNHKKFSILPNGWTEEQDQKLLTLGKQFKGAWKRIAEKYNNTSVSALFLKKRFNELTSAPAQQRSKFTAAEDRMLMKYLDQYGLDWSKIAAHFPNRTAVMIKNRYYSFIKKRDMMDAPVKSKKTLQKESIRKSRMINDCQKLVESSVCSCNHKRQQEYEDMKIEFEFLRKQVQILESLCFSAKAELNEVKTQMNAKVLSDSKKEKESLN